MNSPPRVSASDPAEVTTAFGTVIVDRPREARPDGSETDSGVFPPERLLVGICGAGVALVCVVQLLQLPELLDPARVLTAGFAKPLVLGFALAAIGLIGAAARLPRRLLGWPPAIAAGFAGLVLLATLTVGGEAWSLAAAVLTLSACWVTGTWTLRALRMPALAAMPPVAWLAGSAVVGLFLQLLGRAGLLRWWTVGAVVLILGAFGLYRLVRAATPLAGAAWAAVGESRLAAGCAGLILLSLGMAAIWTAAPEIMYDALYFKAWLPAEWARAGEISPLRDHPWLNVHGFGQVLAIPGHLFGAEGVGRYLQWLAFGLIPASLWWFLRPRTRWAPLAAVIVAVTPALFWQATTAYDDALLVLAAVALAQAVVTLVEQPQKSPLWEGAAVGLLAGACVSLKLHLVFLAFGLALAYLVLRPRSRTIALVGVIAGSLVTGGPPLLFRWLDVGNPVFPALSRVFHSPYWDPPGPGLGLGGGGGGGGDNWTAPITRIWNSVVDPAAAGDRVPVGTYGILTLAILGALLLGAVFLRRRGGSRGVIAIWAGLLLAAVGWWWQIRVLRYLLPAGVVAVMMLGLAARGQRLTRTAEWVSLAAVAAIAVLLWPPTVAQFWNVPGKDLPLAAALKSGDDVDYERRSMPERAALAAFNAASAPGATAVTSASQRAWLSDGRDLQPTWELHYRLQLNGASLPATPEEALRRIRATGTDWALIPSTSQQQGLYYLYGTIARYGELRWAGAGWRLYYLGGRPRAPEARPAIAPPPIREGLAEAQSRIANTIASGDCDRINALYASVESQTDESCETLITLEQSAASGAQAYGNRAGVVDYSTEPEAATMVLVRDSDGLFHIAFVASEESSPTVNTPLAKGADAVAAAAVEAMRAKDCEGFLRVANRAGGIGALPKELACRAIEVDPIQAGLFNAPDARPRRLGGNAHFAFYGLSTPDSYFTIVLAKSDDSVSGQNQPSGAASSQYRYVASYETNSQGTAPLQ
jgi:hypothetical protein